jgi:hypothetical protein
MVGSFMKKWYILTDYVTYNLFYRKVGKTLSRETATEYRSLTGATRLQK